MVLGFTAGRPDATAIAIDPSPLAFPILQRNAGFNAPDQTVDEDENIKIVPVRPIDDVCAEFQYVPDLIKIDVEGCELQCLKGLQNTLRNHRPPFILETHPHMIRPMGYTERDITDLVLDLSYDFYTLDGQKVDRQFVEDQVNTAWYVCHAKEIGYK